MFSPCGSTQCACRVPCVSHINMTGSKPAWLWKSRFAVTGSCGIGSLALTDRNMLVAERGAATMADANYCRELQSRDQKPSRKSKSKTDIKCQAPRQFASNILQKKPQYTPHSLRLLAFLRASACDSVVSAVSGSSVPAGWC
jgi:hypothetical protein